MAIRYTCDNCGKETNQIVSNKEDNGLEFCNDCLKKYQEEHLRVDKEHSKLLEEAKAKIDRRFGVNQKKGVFV